jgi:hypothetical protein
MSSNYKFHNRSLPLYEGGHFAVNTDAPALISLSGDGHQLAVVTAKGNTLLFRICRKLVEAGSSPVRRQGP